MKNPEKTGQKSKVLIVEDNADLSILYRKALEREGFEVKVSSEGMSGVVQAVEFHPDAIILDLLMPMMDGYEVVKAIRQNSSLKVIIVILSNFLDEESTNRIFELGANEVLSKIDFSPRKLTERIKYLLSEKYS